MYLPQRWAAARKGGLFQQGAPRTRVPVLSAACPQGWPRLSGVAVFAVSALLVWIWADLPSGGTPWTQTGEEIDVVGGCVRCEGARRSGIVSFGDVWPLGMELNVGGLPKILCRDGEARRAIWHPSPRRELANVLLMASEALLEFVGKAGYLISCERRVYCQLHEVCDLIVQSRR
ncbi:unnamed protein product [Ostreobium quekettii]|uniref:Uncharacterized protein n=1 Tax=Ostreobium quekettii TaxID=121088 RepID=A0A8S1IXM6_9CHLO|nr:unnamed protein product [Ostreobium quekettii]